MREAANDLRLAQEFVDVETAKQAGRSSFGEMVAFLAGSKDVRTLLVEKTDRLYRNLKDWVTVDESDLEVHFVKENFVLSADSRSSEKFMHGIKVLMAKNYIDNLSEETRKGMTEKAEQGTWPSSAPFGYVNVVAAGGKRTIQPDWEIAPDHPPDVQVVRDRRYPARELTRMARDEGLQSRKTGNVVPQSIIHKMLRNRVYMGEFVWAGKIYQGNHEPLVCRELWERAQSVLDGRYAHRTSGRGATSHSPVSCAVATAAAPWSRSSRRGATSTTTAAGRRVDAPSPTRARRSWMSGSRRCWTACGSTTRFWPG